MTRRRNEPPPDWRYLWIFVATAASFLLGPVLHVPGEFPVGLWVIVFLVSIASLRALWEDRKLLIAVAILGTVHLAVQIEEELTRNVLLLSLTDVSAMLLFGLVTVGILFDIFRRDDITADTVFGASAVYLLIGSFFARTYMLLELYAPGSFAITQPVHAKDAVEIARDPALLGYFSLITLTTMGYGDIVPGRPLARSLAAMEGVFGQLYLAAVIARLVSLYTAHGKRGQSGGASS